jgi:hypothetical protein
VKRIESGKPQHKELLQTDRLLGHRVSVLPEEDEAADAPEDLNPMGSKAVERTEEKVERQLFGDQGNGLVSEVEEMLVVPEQHREGGSEAEKLKTQQSVARRIRRLPGDHLFSTHEAQREARQG